MSRTCEVIEIIQLPEQLPHLTTAVLYDSVCSMHASSEQPSNESIRVYVNPNFPWLNYRKRKIVLSHDEVPELDFPFINAGSFKFKGRDAFFLLEKIN